MLKYKSSSPGDRKKCTCFFVDPRLNPLKNFVLYQKKLDKVKGPFIVKVHLFQTACKLSTALHFCNTETESAFYSLKVSLVLKSETSDCELHLKIRL